MPLQLDHLKNSSFLYVFFLFIYFLVVKRRMLMTEVAQERAEFGESHEEVEQTAPSHTG